MKKVTDDKLGTLANTFHVLRGSYSKAIRKRDMALIDEAIEIIKKLRSN